MRKKLLMLLFCIVIANDIYRCGRQSNSYKDSPWSNRRTRLSAAAAAAANETAAAAASSKSGSESILPLFLLFLRPRPMMVAEVDETAWTKRKMEEIRNMRHFSNTHSRPLIS